MWIAVQKGWESFPCQDTTKLKPSDRSKLNWRAFLKRPENFSGPKAFRGPFRVIFSGPGKCFSKPPETARIPDERFGIFSRVGRRRPWFAAWARKRILECFCLSLWLFRGIFFTFKWKTARIWYIDEVLGRLNPLGVANDVVIFAAMDVN